MYLHNALEENFEIGVHINTVSRLVQGDAVTSVEGSGQHVMHEEEGGHVGEGSSGTEGTGVDPSEVDVGCMDVEAGGSGDEEAADNDDLVLLIQYFHGAGLLECAVIEYNTLSNWGYHNSNI